MKSSWTAGVEDKEELIFQYKIGVLIRERLAEMCKDKAHKAFKLTEDGYECPNWMLKQADTIGYQRALAEVEELLK